MFLNKPPKLERILHIIFILLIPNKQASSCDSTSPANGDKNNKGSVKVTDIDILNVLPGVMHTGLVLTSAPAEVICCIVIDVGTITPRGIIVAS